MSQSKPKQKDALSVISLPHEPLIGKPKRKSNRVLVIFWIVIILIVIIVVTGVIIIVVSGGSNDETNIEITGLFGKWPVYGGNLQNHQTPFVPSMITKDNINDMRINCSYMSSGSTSFDGYIVVDDENNAYFADYSGTITKVNIDTCQEGFRKNIAELLGYNETTTRIVSRNSVTLYIDYYTKQKSILLATPNKRRISSGYPATEPCWLLSLDTQNGTVNWKIDLSQNDSKSTYQCQAHGFVVDNEGKYAYGGVSIFGWSTFNPNNQNIQENQFIGKVYKIDLETHSIADIFYSIPKDKNDDLINANEQFGYIGGGVWNFPLIIDDYIIFGTGDLTTYPDYIGECFKGNLTLNNSYTINPCGIDVSHNKYWSCFEDDIYIDSVVVLNRNTFDIVFVKRLQGIDAWNLACPEYCEGPDCPPIEPPCPHTFGPDADMQALTVINAFDENADDGTYYILAHQKSGIFYVIELPSGEVLISKKVGPWSSTGGANSFSLAVDTTNLISIATITGGLGPSDRYPYKIGDNSVICDTGTIHAIDLKTGYTMWQFVNPYGLPNNCSEERYQEYIDWSWSEFDLCERAFDGSEMKNDTETVSNVVYVMVNDTDSVTDSIERGKFYGAITVVNEMVFVPSISGDIFILDIFDGSLLHTIQCPSNEDDSNRPGIGSGVTVTDTHIVFYCGRQIGRRIYNNDRFAPEGNIMISMTL